MGWREVCVGPRGTEEEKVPDYWAANCHCLALIGYGPDHGIEFPCHSDLRGFDLIRQYLANIEQPVSSCHKISLPFCHFNLLGYFTFLWADPSLVMDLQPVQGVSGLSHCKR